MEERVQHIGTCRFCGQMKTMEYTQDELLHRIMKTGMEAADIADEDATLQCRCPGAEDNRVMRASLDGCDQIIEEMFRETHPELADILQEAKGIVYGGKVVKKVTVTLPEGEGTGMISYGKDGLSVEFKKTLRTSASTGF